MDKLFELAKELTKPKIKRDDATSILFTELKAELTWAIQMGPLSDLEARLDLLLFKYEKHFRRMLEIQKGLD